MRVLSLGPERPFVTQRIGMAVLTLLLAASGVLTAHAQLNDFQIVWVVIGEAATSDKSGKVKAARQLFMANELASLALRNVKIARVEVAPQIIELSIGARSCLSRLDMQAYSPEQKMVERAPLSIGVRQDHREQLGLERTDKDVCVHPTAAGEYPIRFTSLLPARDGTTRGAQIFVRVVGT
jgi:hypothetical protein